MMINRKYMRGLAGLCIISTMMSTTAFAATTTYEMRKKAVNLIGIMREIDKSANVTRGEFARMLVKASEHADTAGTVSNVSVYADVPATDLFASAIRTAASKEWMTGYLGGNFKPEQGITLREAARAVLKLLGYSNEDFSGNINENRMSKFAELGLGANIFRDANDTLTREDCIHLFYNLMRAKTKNGAVYGSQVFNLKFSTDGEINLSSILDDSIKGPKLLDSDPDSLEDILPFSTKNATFFLDGEMCDMDMVIDGALLIYYHESTKMVFGYSEYGGEKGVTFGEIESIHYDSSDLFTPVSVELDTDDQENEESGDIFKLSQSEIQYMFSMYGDFKIGDEIGIIWEKNGNGDNASYTAIDVIEEE